MIKLLNLLIALAALILLAASIVRHDRIVAVCLNGGGHLAPGWWSEECTLAK